MTSRNRRGEQRRHAQPESLTFLRDIRFLSVKQRTQSVSQGGHSKGISKQVVYTRTVTNLSTRLHCSERVSSYALSLLVGEKPLKDAQPESLTFLMDIRFLSVSQRT